MQICVFCGQREPACHKLLSTSYVQELLQRQKQAGVSEPVLDFMWTMLPQPAPGETHEESGEECMQQEEAHEQAEEQLAVLRDAEPEVLACMCCFYWVERRRTLSVTPLPMQNLLWFVRTLSWCEKVCDSRLLHRLVCTVAAPGNVFAPLFEKTELEGLQSIASELRTAQARPQQVLRMQGVKRFCVKRALAKLWHAHNVYCICLPHAAAADWLRSA